MKEKKEQYTVDDVLRKFEMLLEETTLSAYDIYNELAEEFGKKPKATRKSPAEGVKVVKPRLKKPTGEGLQR